MISIRAEKLGKAYEIYERPIDSLKELLFKRSYHETFWALRDVDFSLPLGETLGLVGENGAGKSTLLKLLAGTMSATCGRLERRGRVSAILELGSGFHPELSGEDNIRIGCAVIGLSPAETDERLPDIISFSELGEFIPRPVKTYSTGMYLRLAFSVASSVDPDILIIDEALSVGDQHFQKKCMDRMMTFREQGKTMIFCSHDLYSVKHICERCLWLRNGRLEMLGPTMDVVESYQDYERARDAKTAADLSEQTSQEQPPGHAHLCDVTIDGDCRDGTIDSGGTLAVRVVAHLAQHARNDAHIGLLIVRNDEVCCYGVSTAMDDFTPYPMGAGKYGVTFVVDRLPLLAGEYRVDAVLLDGSAMHPYEFRKGAASFTVRHGTMELGLARLGHRWERP